MEHCNAEGLFVRNKLLPDWWHSHASATGYQDCCNPCIVSLLFDKMPVWTHQRMRHNTSMTFPPNLCSPTHMFHMVYTWKTASLKPGEFQIVHVKCQIPTCISTSALKGSEFLHRYQQSTGVNNSTSRKNNLQCPERAEWLFPNMHWQSFIQNKYKRKDLK